jgi:hypothetical protein
MEHYYKLRSSIRSTLGSLQNNVLLLGDMSSHNSDVKHGFAQGEDVLQAA